MKPKSSHIALAMLLLASLACSLPFGLGTTAATPAVGQPENMATAPPAQAASGAECIVGTWQLSDLAEYMKSVVPDTGGTLTYQGMSGSARYIFGGDGKAQVEADNLQVSYKMGAGINLDFQVGFNGHGTADYTVTEGNLLSTSNVNVDGLALTITMGGVPVGDSSTLGSIVPFFGESSAAMPFICTATTLSYTPPTEGAHAVVFTRVSP
jgi:hypothetical protein